MMFATALVAVYRDTDIDALGDEEDDDRTPVPGLERVRVALTERSRTVFDPSAGEMRTIRVATGRAVVGTDLQPNDRLRDLRTGKWWRIGGLDFQGRDAVGMRALSFDLRGL